MCQLSQATTAIAARAQPTAAVSAACRGRLAHTARHTGDIRVNGHKSQLSYGRSAYVTQDDVLIGTLTVYETIFYSAKLRLPQVRTRLLLTLRHASWAQAGVTHACAGPAEHARGREGADCA